MDIQPSTDSNETSIYKKYWFHTATVLLLLSLVLFIIIGSSYFFYENLILGSFFFISIWLILLGFKIKKISWIIRLFLILGIIALSITGFIPVILAVFTYALPLGIGILIHFIFAFIFLWNLPVTKELWDTTNKTKFFLKLSILVALGIALWWLMFIVAAGID